MLSTSYKKNNLKFQSFEKCCDCQGSLIQTVIIGSFRKHLKEIISLKQTLENSQIKVLSPIDDTVINPNEEFVIFESDLVSDPKILQNAVFAKIRSATFVVVANVNGYLGQATMMEIGYALAEGIDIFTLEPVQSPHLLPYCKPLSDFLLALQNSEVKRNYIYN